MSQSKVVPTQKTKRPVFHRSVQATSQVRILLHSDDFTVREAVKTALGTQITSTGLIPRVEAGGLDLLILDGEAAKNGGMGLCRQLKNEVYRCPDVLVLTGREQDAWLAAWSLADAVVPHPIDPVRLRQAVGELLGVKVG